MEWKEVRLGDVCTKITDGSHFSPKAQTEGYPMLSVKDMREYDFDFSNCKKISYEDYLKMERDGCVPQIGDVLVAKDGSYLKEIFRCKEQREIALLSSIAIFRPNSQLIDSRFLCYCLKSPRVYNYISLNCVSGSALPRIILKDFKGVNIRVPSLDDQRRIASILSSLDRKIELNNKINADLEEMAQAIFKNWFVDFEPFKDGKFVDSELGMIPEGWKVGTLGDITKNKSAKVKEKNDVKVLSPVTTGELVLSEEYFTKQVFSSSIAKYKIVNKGEFAYNPARVNIGSLGRNEFDFDGCVSPVYVVFSVLEGYENYFDLFRKTDFFKDSVASLAIGGVRQSLSYDDLSLIETIIPSENIVEKFNNLYNQMKKTIKANKQENSRLSLLRDTLLPRLMSGELEVPE